METLPKKTPVSGGEDVTDVKPGELVKDVLEDLRLDLAGERAKNDRLNRKIGKLNATIEIRDETTREQADFIIRLNADHEKERKVSDVIIRDLKQANEDLALQAYIMSKSVCRYEKALGEIIPPTEAWASYKAVRDEKDAEG